MTNSYRVTGERPVLDNEPGAEFEHEFASPEEEADYVRQGRLEIVARAYKVVGPHAVSGTAPGKQFEAAFPMETERFLIEGGHIERVKKAASGGKSTTSKE